jgi:hypothetical protein
MTTCDNMVELLDATTADVPAKTSCYPTRSCRNVMGNQLYDAYTPRIQFLQLGEEGAHRSALTAINE